MRALSNLLRAALRQTPLCARSGRPLMAPAVGLCAALAGAPAAADFLLMPDITQQRDARSQSLLRDLDIPAVRHRDPDPTGGPRLAVSEFRIQGLMEYPELGITREALRELTESIRFELMEEGKQLESGYTIRELAELSDLLSEIEDEAQDRHVTPMDVQRLVWLVRGQRAQRGVTVGQMEAVANTITDFYRERGFVLAKAYIPQQQVRDGIVTITLMLGMLGEVSVNGNALYASGDLAGVFDDMLGRPVTSARVEENLFLINSFPGVFVDGYFEPGHQVGDTALRINVRNEARFNANVRADNHGTPESGRYRFYVDAHANNTFGLRDMIHASYLKAVDPSNNDYYRLHAELGLFSPRLRFGADTSVNQFVVDNSAIGQNIDLHGDVYVKGINAKYLARRSRTRNVTYEIRHEEVESDLQIGNIPDVNNALDDTLRNTHLMYHFDFLQEQRRRLHQGSLKLTNGKVLHGADPGQDSSYQTLRVDYSALNFWRVPLFEADTRVIARTSLQYAGKNLSSIARYSLAGPTRARGYGPGTFTADDAVYVGVDWLFNAPAWMDFNLTETVNVRRISRPLLFVDYAYGKQHTLDPDERNATAQVLNVGVGVQFAHANRFGGNLMVGIPVWESFRGTAAEPSVDSYRVVADVHYSF